MVELAQSLKFRQLLVLRGKVAWQGSLETLRSGQINSTVAK